ncbi:IBR finger domain protein [Cordyceps fumosorosea ARSEF 2679]|uniref:IBR finger domain protein n=1 Tax=Cordyceps fumosorosea (strain ARSEF 2679) TaxID=1081104 RepID=A0A167NL75_CORFA|nr:IBR finger domain protein [Cordyceps fumosorosea ARSEF 2679]OAA55678.1 IBR finger domain protein [Cordyceps fumosorosea ARSEF 2679]
MATGDAVIHTDEYAKEVLGLDAGLTEDAIDADLVAKAAALGITTSTLQKRTASSAFSSSFPSGSSLDRKISPAAVPRSLPATPPSSVFATSSTDLACGGDGAAAAGFALYDQFIAAAVSAPALEQVRLRNGSLPVVADSSARSTMSVGTRKSFSSVKSGFKPRSWWRRKTDPAL